MTNVLFICMGNICRSPTAHGVFEHKVAEQGLSDQINVDSAGTHAYHIGEAPDPRSQAMARSRGYDLSAQRARQVETSDFTAFDYLIAMDRANYDNLLKIAPEDQKHKVHLCLSFAKNRPETEVPDPYYNDGFDDVLEMIEDASDGLLDHIKNN
ncbi:low molecular weight protein-tyrosine-phosphatase [Leucothrix pacifica]|uniref:protein-tyrosine-phosphatase n=1 Tax=Leucothrix pacifica TaxID=1247513 RepID=A0A317C2N3_9GAMM|nr:low molecular weight protein-tyrosine-phosphatase [Leucothrix pacifica]PWQ92818.1 phosphotyrosine protein phosphatase [Leucothrix pacifica]